MSSVAPRSYRLFAGIDVAAKSFTASWTQDRRDYARSVKFEYSPTGISQFQAQIQATGVAPAETLIVLEATGSYWITLAVSLHAAGYVVSVVNPAQVHAWAQSLPRRGKTDPLDARVLTQFAAERVPARWMPPPAVYHELRQRLSARDALRELRQQARNQRHALAQWPVVVASVMTQLDELIADLDARISSLEQEIEQVLAQGEWASSAALLQSISGIGMLTAAWLLVLTVNFTRCPSAAALSNYAGLTPLARDSGTSVRGRAQLGHSGSVRLRTVMYLATLSAARHNPIIKAFYNRLRLSGKPMKVARCAAARKLLELAYAVVSKQRRFDPAYQSGVQAQERVSKSA
jgi:transposase